MRKLILAAVLMLVALLGASFVAAQDATAMAYGDILDGEISDAEPEVLYTFDAVEGDIVLIEAFGEPGTFGVDPKIVLMDDDGDTIMENDDLAGVSAVVLNQIRKDGTYTISVQQSYEGSEGVFYVRLSKVEPTALGTTIDTAIYSSPDDVDTALPQFIVLYFDSDVNLKIDFAQELSELYAQLRIVTPDPESYSGYTTVASIDDTRKVSAASLTVELDDDTLYMIYVRVAFSSFSFNIDKTDITLTIGEA